MIAVGGSVAGIVLGQLGAYWFAPTYVSMLGIPFLESRIHSDVMAQALLISGGACLAAGILPALGSARIAPAKAMHSDPNAAVSAGPAPARGAALRVGDAAVVHVADPVAQHLPVAPAQRSTRSWGSRSRWCSRWPRGRCSTRSAILMDDVFGRSERWDVMAVFEQTFGAAAAARGCGSGSACATRNRRSWSRWRSHATGQDHARLGDHRHRSRASTFHGFKVTAGVEARSGAGRRAGS